MYVKVKDNSEELVFSFHLYMGSKDQAQVAKITQQAPLLTEPLYWPM